MIDIAKFQLALAKYKDSFIENFKKEKYKWQAVKFFLDNWDINSPDFAQTVKVAFSKHINLLDNRNNFPLAQIVDFAKADCEAMRNSFKLLYDDNVNLSSRIESFKAEMERIRGQYDPGTWKTLYQDENPISIYLRFRFPDKYYIYKFGECKNAAAYFNTDYFLKKGDGINNINTCYKFYDELCELLKKDTELISLYQSVLDNTTYPDGAFKLLTDDFVFYVSRYICAKTSTLSSKPVDVCWYVGAAWSQGQKDYADEFIDKGIWVNGFPDKLVDVVNSINVGDHIAIKSSYVLKKGLPFDINGGFASVMRIKAIGVVTENAGDGHNLKVDWDINYDGSKIWYFYTNRTTVWKVSRQTSWCSADLLDFTFAEKEQDYDKFLNDTYWRNLYGLDNINTQDDSADEFVSYPVEYKKYIDQLLQKHNIILHGAPGTGKSYTAKNIAKALGCTDNEIGFIQFHPSYDYTDFVEGLRPTPPDEKGNIGFERKDGVFVQYCNQALKNLVDSGKSTQQISHLKAVETEYYQLIEDFQNDKVTSLALRTPDKSMDIVRISDKGNLILKASHSSYDVEYVLSLDRILKLADVFQDKKALDSVSNIDKEIRSVIGGCNTSSFWAALSYLYKKIGNSKKFVEVVDKKKYVFIIDEINRGDISKIFGELFYSLEPSCRGIEGSVRTQYSNMVEEPNLFDQQLGITDANNYGHFFIPDNVYIIGTMNDIDRSVENMDFAMRRRFVFQEITAEESAQSMGITCPNMKRLNDEIEKVLGRDYQVGGYYFLDNKEGRQTLEQLWQDTIEPLLREYLRGTRDAQAKLEEFKIAFYGN